MKLSNKNVEDVVVEVAGNDVLPLLKALKNKKNVSEFKLAEQIKTEINFVRNMLYRLYHANLVTFTRKKDKKKGWYIYYWTFNTKRVKFLMADLKKKKLEKLNERLNREKNSFFYICKNGCMRLDFEQSTSFEFKCPECGQIMYPEDNAETIEKIKKEIELIEKSA
jgi:transcription initiation factor TFIIE subunit alpha